MSKVDEFITKHGASRGRILANALGFKGAGAVYLANEISGIAWNWRSYRPGQPFASAAMQAFVRTRIKKWSDPPYPVVQEIFAEIKAVAVTQEVQEIIKVMEQQ